MEFIKGSIMLGQESNVPKEHILIKRVEKIQCPSDFTETKFENGTNVVLIDPIGSIQLKKVKGHPMLYEVIGEQSKEAVAKLFYGYYKVCPI